MVSENDQHCNILYPLQLNRIFQWNFSENQDKTVGVARKSTFKCLACLLTSLYVILMYGGFSRPLQSSCIGTCRPISLATLTARIPLSTTHTTIVLCRDKQRRRRRHGMRPCFQLLRASWRLQIPGHAHAAVCAGAAGSRTACRK